MTSGHGGPAEIRATSTESRSGAVSASRAAVSAAVALAGTVIIYETASALDASFDVGSPEPISALTVAVSAAVPVALGAVVVALLARRYAGFPHVAAWAGLAFALVSTVGAFRASADVGTALALSAMHVVVGVAWFFAVGPRGRASALI